MIASCGSTTTVLLSSSSSCCLRWFRSERLASILLLFFWLLSFVFTKEFIFHSFQNVTKTRALFDGTPSIIMLRAGGVQTQMTTTMNKVLSSCVCSSVSSTSSNLMATTRGPFATATATRYHHHHHHRAHNGKTMFSTTGFERRTMCTKAASSSNDTNNNKTTTPQEQWKASIDFKAIRENQKHVERNCANRNVAVDVSAGRNLMTFLRDATHRI